MLQKNDKITKNDSTGSSFSIFKAVEVSKFVCMSGLNDGNKLLYKNSKK